MTTSVDPVLAKALTHAQQLLNASIAVVGAAHIEVDSARAKNPKVVAITILCRTISNFRAAVSLVQQGQVQEARALLRLMYENLLWLAALRERGAAFVRDMIDDEAFNRKALAQRTLQVTARCGADVDRPDALKLRSIIKELERQYPKSRKLEASKTAAVGVAEMAYVEYGRFSLEAVHCSVTALGRHISTELIDETNELVVSVIAQTSPAEVLSTVLDACRALMGAAIAANELLGFTTGTATLTALMSEFKANGW